MGTTSYRIAGAAAGAEGRRLRRSRVPDPPASAPSDLRRLRSADGRRRGSAAAASQATQGEACGDRKCAEFWIALTNGIVGEGRALTGRWSLRTLRASSPSGWTTPISRSAPADTRCSIGLIRAAAGDPTASDYLSGNAKHGAKATPSVDGGRHCL